MLNNYFNYKVANFKAGQISTHYDLWCTITSDPVILATISGESVELIDNVPHQKSYPINSINKEHVIQVENEIQKLLYKGVIVNSYHEQGEYISPIFSVPKSDGSIRLILNLKQFNEFVKFTHFKMESIHTILELVTPGCWMASIDLKDAYYSVKIHPQSQKYLKFFYKTQLFMYTAYPNGLSSCPRKFTKLIKPLLSELHLKGHIVAGYIDDFYLQSDSYNGCIENVIDTILMFDQFGFVVHPEKSVFTPKQQIVFLGFVINSVTMKVYLKKDKKSKLKDHLLFALQNQGKLTIEYVAKIIGYIVSSLPAVQFGALYYRSIERDKIRALAVSKGNFEAKMSLPVKAQHEVKWWIDNVDQSFNVIRKPAIQLTMYSDASLKGWGGVLGKVSTGGQWSADEFVHNINYLELRAAFLVIKTFIKEIANIHVKIMIDNTSAVSIINNMGTCKSEICNDIVVALWELCIDNNTLVTAAHIAGVCNTVADKESRNFHIQHTEWKLDSLLLHKALNELEFAPEIDLFASRINNQFATYCSYRPDPGATFVDAFSISWADFRFYCFPPFSCILRVLQKVKQDKATGVIVVPQWPTQTWYSVLMTMLVLPPILLKPSPKLLTLPTQPLEKHPLHKKTVYLVCLLSGENSLSKGTLT